MTAIQFTHLDESTQAGILLDRGTFLAERSYKNFIIFLYELDGFYVEVHHNLRYNMMQGIRCFDDDEALQPYLESIDISCLYD